MRILNHHKHNPLRVDILCNIDTKGLTLGTRVSLAAITFNGTNFGNLVSFWAKKISTEHWAVCDASNPNTNFTKAANNETLTLNPKPREEF